MVKNTIETKKKAIFVFIMLLIAIGSLPLTYIVWGMSGMEIGVIFIGAIAIGAIIGYLVVYVIFRNKLNESFCKAIPNCVYDSSISRNDKYILPPE